MVQLIKGFKDILPGESEAWRYVESLAVEVFEGFGFSEIRPPVMEQTALFKRGIGEHTDIVEKEMYTFEDRGGDQITLRPEATASVVRAYIQHKLYAANPVRKLYTIGPMFRRERPQKGRYRQFHQINAEVFGIAAPFIDAQLILMLTTFFDRLNVTDTTLHINSLGCHDCRPEFKKALREFLEDRRDKLCDDCQRRFDRNPLRILDCKAAGCREASVGAPMMADHLCPVCRDHFDTVTGLLGELAIPFELNNRLVRGLDYYTRTTFEIQTNSLGAQNAIAGGGRYDSLVKLLGGPAQPAVGFAVGLERLVELVTETGSLPVEKAPALYLAALDEASREKAFGWLCELNRSGIAAEMSFEQRSLKSQMKQADKFGAAYTLMIGENELAAGSVVLRDMTTKSQQDLPMDNLVPAIKSILSKRAKQ